MTMNPISSLQVITCCCLQIANFLVFFFSRCASDETVEYISSDDQRNKKFSLEAFKFLGEHEFVYMHCKVKICNAKDPNSRCAQGCLSDRQKRSLYTEENNDEEYLLAQGPFMRKDEINEETVLQDVEEVHDMNIKGKVEQNIKTRRSRCF